MVRKLTILEAIEPFLYRPKEEIHLSEISRIIDAPHVTVRQWLEFFEEKGVLKKSNKGRLSLYSLNLDNPNIGDYLVIAEKNRLIASCEKDVVFRELASLVNQQLEENSLALVFGSAAISLKKADDIDLLVTGNIDEKVISNKINKEIHLINLKSLKDISASLKQEIIKKHIIIKGTEDIIRWMLW